MLENLVEAFAGVNSGVVLLYFCLKPAGQVGFAPVTFLLNDPLTQVIVLRVAGFDGALGATVAAGADAIGVGVTTGAALGAMVAGWPGTLDNLIESFGDE